MDNDILKLSCDDLRQKIVAGEVRSAEVVQATLNAVDRADGTVGAYLQTFAAQALHQAEAVDKKVAAGQPVGLLAGLPIAIKDNLCTTFGVTSCGSKILEHFHAPYNATVVEKLLAADAVIVGKTNLDEFAMGSSTENSGLQRTRNPWDTSRVPGGSSGGSAAATAACLCAAALGSDTGGSIRQPASFCGVVGLKPTYGRVSRYGLVAYGSSLDQIGPFARNVTDCALMLQAIADYDERDSTSVPLDQAPVPAYGQILDQPVDDLVVGVVPQANAGADASVQQALQDALTVYRGLGAKVVEIDMPHLDYAIAAYYVIATAEASSNLARYDGVHYGHRSSQATDVLEVYTKSREEALGAEVKRRIMLGTYALSSGYYDAYYLKALKVRNLIRADFTAAFKKCDCLLMPVAPSTAFKIGEKAADPLQMYLADIYTIAVNLAGVPGISIPAGMDDQDLPIGLQIIAPAFAEEKILRIARMFEVQTNWHTQLPAVVA